MFGTNRAVCLPVVTQAFQRVRALDAVLSDYRHDSEVRRLGRAGKPTQVSRELFTVLQYAQNVSRKTDGAFDVTVGPLVMMWRQARISGRLPPAAERDRRLAVVGWEKLVLGDREVTPAPKLRLDLGGIAKGFIADEVLKTLENGGFPVALVDAGGDIAAGKTPPGEASWRVVIDHKNQDPEVIQLPGGRAVATSGSTYQFLEINGVNYSHIVDPRTGLGTTHGGQVTVMADDCMAADAWASALSVLGAEGAKSLQLPESLKVHWSRNVRSPKLDELRP